MIAAEVDLMNVIDPHCARDADSMMVPTGAGRLRWFALG